VPPKKKKRDSYLQNNQTKIDWKCGSSGREKSEVQTQSHQKKKKKKVKDVKYYRTWDTISAENSLRTKGKGILAIQVWSTAKLQHKRGC
jgi:hypothetical protein